MMLINILFALAEIIADTAYVFSDILTLRALITTGSIVSVAAGFIAGYQSEGMLSIIVFNSIAIVLNVYQGYKIIIARTPILLPNNLKDIYREMFSMMTPNEFFRIYQFSHITTYAKGQQLAVQNEPIPQLLIIQTGQAEVIKNGEVRAQLGSNLFVGEMSFLTGGNANATVAVTSDKVQCISWDKSEINKLETSDGELYSKLKQAIAINLIKKLDQEPKHAVAEKH